MNTLDLTNFDPERIIELLIEQQVDFVIIGGLGATLHGAEIPTSDVDILYNRSRDNLERLASALQRLNVRLRGAEDVPLHVDAILLRNGDAFTFATPFGAFDCMATAEGAPAYAELERRSWKTTLGPHPVKVASLDDLIAMKQTTGRLKDIPKLAELIELRKLVGEETGAAQQEPSDSTRQEPSDSTQQEPSNSTQQEPSNSTS